VYFSVTSNIVNKWISRITLSVLLCTHHIMLLCAICSDEIFENDEVKCTKCNLFLHFGWPGQKEVNFRKMSQKVIDMSCLKF